MKNFCVKNSSLYRDRKLFSIVGRYLQWLHDFGIVHYTVHVAICVIWNVLTAISLFVVLALNLSNMILGFMLAVQILLAISLCYFSFRRGKSR